MLHLNKELTKASTFKVLVNKFVLTMKSKEARAVSQQRPALLKKVKHERNIQQNISLPSLFSEEPHRRRP